MYRFNGVLLSQKSGSLPPTSKSGGPFPPLPKSRGPENYAYENSLARAAVEVKAPNPLMSNLFIGPKSMNVLNTRQKALMNHDCITLPDPL